MLFWFNKIENEAISLFYLLNVGQKTDNIALNLSLKLPAYLVCLSALRTDSLVVVVVVVYFRALDT